MWPESPFKKRTMSIPRMMTRRMMIVVAAIALVLGGTTEFLRQQRAAEYLGIAMKELGYTQQALAVSDELEQEAMVTHDPRRASQCRTMATSNRKWATYTSAVARWYLEAASRPWPYSSKDALQEPKEDYVPPPPGSPHLK
jgi:hypothetical protein